MCPSVVRFDDAESYSFTNSNLELLKVAVIPRCQTPFYLFKGITVESEKAQFRTTQSVLARQR